MPMRPVHKGVPQILIVSLAAVLSVLGCASREPQSTPRYEAAYHDSAQQSKLQFLSIDDRKVGPQTSADYHYSMGESMSLDGRPQEAIDEFRAALVHDEKSAPLRVRLASEYVKAGRMEQATQVLEEVKELDPKNVDARILLGGIYGSLKSYSKAIEEYESIIQNNSLHFEANLYLGAVYAEQKQYPKALKYFEKLTTQDESPLLHLAWFYKGRVHLDDESKGAKQKAVASFEKALAAKPSYVEALFALAQAHLKGNDNKAAVDVLVKYQKEQGPSARVAEMLAQFFLEQEDYPSALEQLRIVEKQADDMLNAKVKIALILIEQKQYKEAADKLTEVLIHVPDSDKVRFYLAAVYEELDNKTEAVANFKLVPPGSPYFGEAMVHGAYILRQLKETDAALELATKGLGVRNDLPQLYALKASLLDDKAQFSEATLVLNEGIAKFPDNAQLIFYHGTVSDHAGHKPAVITSMRRVLEIDPNHVQALNYLAYTLAEQGTELGEAEKLAKKALELDPNDGYIQDTYGWILFKQGKVRDAIIQLEAAHEKQPNESIIAEHLGDAYLELSMVEKAREMYRRAAASAEAQPRQELINQKLSSVENQKMPNENSRQPASSK